MSRGAAAQFDLFPLPAPEQATPGAGAPAGRRPNRAAAEPPSASRRAFAGLAEALPPDLLWAALPPTLARLAELMPLPCALRLAEWKPGERLYVPAGPEPAGELARRIGMDAARALAARHGGEYLEIPTAAAVQRLIRNEAMLREAAAGAGTIELARRYGISPRQVRNIKRDRRGGADITPAR